MTETPQQPALTEDEQKTVRSAALRAGALVAQAEPGFLDTFKESFAASKAVKAGSPEVQKLVTGGLPEMPSGDRDETKARTLELLKQAVGILTEKSPVPSLKILLVQGRVHRAIQFNNYIVQCFKNSPHNTIPANVNF